MKAIRLVLLAMVVGSLCIPDVSAQSSRRRTSNTTSQAAAAAAPAPAPAAAPEIQQNNEFEDFLTSILKNAFIILREDYQLVDEDEGYIRTQDKKEYWGRSYSLGARIGDSDFLISGESLRPWQKDESAQNTRYVPTISQCAIRSFEGTEFEPIDFDPDDATAIREKRLFTFSGSEEPGLSLIGLTGHTNGYVLWCIPESPISEENEDVAVNLKFEPMSLNILESKGIYNCNSTAEENALGGFYLVPVNNRPGAVDFCIVGMIQKIGGVWKVVSVTESTEIQATACADYLGEALDGLFTDMDGSMQEFLVEVGLE